MEEGHDKGRQVWRQTKMEKDKDERRHEQKKKGPKQALVEEEKVR